VWKTTVAATWPVTSRPDAASFDVRHSFSGEGRARRPDGRPYVLKVTISAWRIQTVKALP
jgi:hypothetical protein